MKTSVKEVNKVQVVDLKGRITLGAGDVILRDTVLKLLEGGHNQIVLNMQGVDYIDSAGIGELVACKKRAVAKGGDVRLIMPSEGVYKVLSIVSLHLIFQILPNETQAVSSF